MMWPQPGQCHTTQKSHWPTPKLVVTSQSYRMSQEWGGVCVCVCDRNQLNIPSIPESIRSTVGGVGGVLGCKGPSFSLTQHPYAFSMQLS